MEHLLSPRSRGDSFIQSYPTGSQIGAPSHVHQDSWHPLAAPTACLWASERDVSVCIALLGCKRSHLGLEADATLHYSNVFHGAPGAPPHLAAPSAAGDLTPGTFFPIKVLGQTGTDCMVC